LTIDAVLAGAGLAGAVLTGAGLAGAGLAAAVLTAAVLAGAGLAGLAVVSVLWLVTFECGLSCLALGPALLGEPSGRPSRRRLATTDPGLLFVQCLTRAH